MELARGNRESSEKAFKRAVELGPHTAAPHLALGGFYWATSQWPAAERELTEALNLDRKLQILALVAEIAASAPGR